MATFARSFFSSFKGLAVVFIRRFDGVLLKITRLSAEWELLWER